MKSYKRRFLFKLLLGGLFIFASFFSICTFIHIKNERQETKANIHFWKGIKFLYKGDYRNAIRNFDEAGRLCPKLYGEISKDVIASLNIAEQLREWERGIRIRKKPELPP